MDPRTVYGVYEYPWSLSAVTSCCGTHETDSQPKQMSCLMGKLIICICENKDADKLGNRKADQRLCFGNTDSTSSP